MWRVRPCSGVVGVRQPLVRPDVFRGGVGIPVFPVFQFLYGEVIAKRLGDIADSVMPDELPDELPDNVPQWYGKPFRKVDGNPEQCGFRPVVMAEQTEMEPSFFLFQIDTLRHALVHPLAQLGDFQTGPAPFPFTDSELCIPCAGILPLRLVSIL